MWHLSTAVSSGLWIMLALGFIFVAQAMVERAEI
jgi:hypothetical protein